MAHAGPAHISLQAGTYCPAVSKWSADRLLQDWAKQSPQTHVHAEPQNVE